MAITYFAEYDDNVARGFTLDEAFHNLVISSGYTISTEQATFFEAEAIEVQLERKPTLKKTNSKE